MIGRIEAWLKLTRDRGQTVRECMLLPIDHFARSKPQVTFGRLAGGRQPVTATPGARRRCAYPAKATQFHLRAVQYILVSPPSERHFGRDP